MFQAKDGKKFGSKFAGRKYDEMHALPAESATHEKTEAPEFEAGEQEGAQEGAEQHPIVASHGRAHTVHVKHNHTANKHHVTSMHDDGHVNESDHATAEEAHSEASQLAGIPGEKPAQEDGLSGGSELLDEASSGHKVPHAA